jgi:hypothetical protein
LALVKGYGVSGVDGRSSASSSSSSSSSSISGRIVACHRCERISVRERTEQKREREEEFIYIKKKNPTPGPRPKKQILFLIIPFLVFPLACLVFFGIFFPDRVWQSSLRLEEGRERERERETVGCCGIYLVLFSWIISRICVEDLGQNLVSSAAVEAYDC